jgi:transcriptional regulator with PAS, ATPase and Fis domain
MEVRIMAMSPPGRPLIGSSSVMKSVVAYATKVARTDATVLITGETGTGKELLAHHIHANSVRRERSFVCINCSTLPDALFEGEMFGYERGAFTGADRSYRGKLSLAAGGTVFLDEVGELSPSAQAKLLRVLESHEVFRLGARATEPIDVRVIAATNRDLEDVAHPQMFRRDLFFRLNVARLHMPPLRTRQEDIPALMAHYVTEMSRRTGASLGPFAPDLVECLLRYTWPGNVRELRNVLEALFIDPPEGTVTIDHLPPNLVRMMPRLETDDRAERARILTTLVETRWNKYRAAKALHWSRMTLYRKMAKHGIRGEPPECDPTPST